MNVPMNPLAARAISQARLVEVDAAIAAGDRTAASCFARAQLLDALGETAAARAAYLATIERDPAHGGALNEFGRLLERTGFRSAARTAFERAVAVAPTDPAGFGNLGSALLDAGDDAGARRAYEAAIGLDPRHATAHACLAIMALRAGDRVTADAHARLGFAQNATAWPYRGADEPVRAVVLHSALGGNVAFERHLTDTIFAKWTVATEFYNPERGLPPHDVLVNAIGDADRCGAALAAAAALAAVTNAPVVNAPSAVSASTRLANAERFACLPGVRAPLTRHRTRAQLSAAGAAAELERAGFTWPLIVRAPGFHTGQHCVRVDRPAVLAHAVGGLPGESFVIVEWIGLADRRGRFCKYRMMVVGGVLYPLHLAIGSHWMVHYFSADMADRPDHRAADAAFLADPRAVLGSPAMNALDAIAATLALDYGGIDFALDPAGRVVVFEANATMNVLPPGPEPYWAYRCEPVARVDRAIRTMLCRAANSQTQTPA